MPSGAFFFGMSEDDFKAEGDKIAMSGREWLSGLIEVWTDGKKETNAIVSEWTESWKSLTAETREGLQGLKDAADSAGYTGLSEQMSEDLKTLDSMDAEIASLLKKRQNGYFSDSDKIRLQELVDTRNAIAVKYKLVPETSDTEGFETIRKKVEAEVTRAAARGPAARGRLHRFRLLRPHRRPQAERVLLYLLVSEGPDL